VEERDYKLYVHISPNDKRYYGITKQKTEYRWRNGKAYKNNKYFINAIKKYGWNNFKHEVLFTDLTKSEAKLLEQIYIVLYDTTNREKGYNITLGGEGSNGLKHTEESKQRISKNNAKYWKGKHLTEETRKKLSKANKGKNHPMYGKNLSEETKQKLSETHKGKNLSEETKQKLSKAFKGKNHPMYGKHLTEETKKKISEANKGKHHTEEAKKKMSEARKGKNIGNNNPTAKSVICLTTGRIFFTGKEAGEYYNTGKTHISSCCKGKRKSAGKLPDGTPLVWRYLNYKHNKKYRVIKNFREAI
jgi:group I intron endonuclease